MSNLISTLLLIEDDPQIRKFVRMAFTVEGWEVVEAATLGRGLIEAGTRKPDLVILDLGLPDGEGKDFIREFRTWSQIPVIILSARTQETEKVHALDLGADDYLTKPFGIDELLARVRANMRRQHRNGHEAVFSFGDVTVDLSAGVVTKRNTVVHLTPIEYRLLTILITNVGRVMTQRQLLREVWGPTFIEHNHYLRIYMAHLRQKLEEDSTQPQYLLTETGVGYRLVQG